MSDRQNPNPEQTGITPPTSDSPRERGLVARRWKEIVGWWRLLPLHWKILLPLLAAASIALFLFLGNALSLFGLVSKDGWRLFLKIFFLLVLLLASYPLFLWCLRRPLRGIVATILLFLFGVLVYLPPRRTHPSDLNKKDPFAHALAVSDNALSSFFLSRGDYDPPDVDSTSQANHVEITYTLVMHGPCCAWWWANPTHAETNMVSRPKGSLAKVPAEARHDGPCPLSSWVSWFLRRCEHVFDSDLAYYLFHTLCYAYGAAFLCTLFGRRLTNILWLFLYRLWKKDFVVFWDAGPESLAAMGALKSTRKKIVVALRRNRPFSLRRDPTPEEEALENLSIVWIYLPPQRFEKSKKFSRWEVGMLQDAVSHYWLGPDGQANVATAQEMLNPASAIALWGNAPHAVRPDAKFFIRIDADSEEDVLFRWADRNAQNSKKASHASPPEIVLIHEPSLIARRWIRSNPFQDEARQGVRLLFIGYGALGKALLREAVQSGLRPGAPLLATVVDRSEASFEPFRTFWAEMKRNYGAETDDFCIPARFSFSVGDVRDGDFWSKIFQERPEEGWSHVVFALPDDLLNLRLASEFERQYRERGFPLAGPEGPAIFAAVRNPGNTGYARTLFPSCEGGDTAKGGISVFGDLSEIYDSLDADFYREDAGARYLNWRYANQKLPEAAFTEEDGRRFWRTASFFDKESTRSAVSGLFGLARELGFEPHPSTAKDHASAQGSALDEALKDEKKLGYLAETEHLRWCAFLLFRRIRPWLHPDKGQKCISELLGGRNATVKPNDRTENLRHAALVPYRDLADVAELFRQANMDAGYNPPHNPIDKTDLRFVESMAEVLAHTGWTFERLDGTSSNPSARETLAWTPVQP